jgi:cation diffusion facilitator CzcD-associated flavoprotein CzcO
MRRQIPDPDLREILTPDYTLGCKRVLHSDDYYPALTQPNVTVVDGAAREVHAAAVSGPGAVEPGRAVANGTTTPPAASHPADVIVYCTGFKSTTMPFSRRIYGRDGRSLDEVWGPSPRAYLGTTVSGFPNLFLLRGPNTGLGHNSILPMIEAQIEHILGALQHMEASGTAALEPRPAAQERFVEQVDRGSENTVWTDGGCDSWYLDESGRNAVLWPRSVAAFRRQVEEFDPSEYIAVRQPASSSGAVSQAAPEEMRQTHGR